MSIKTHKYLAVWQKAMTLAANVYRLSKQLPRAEEYRMTSQLLRAVVSIPANIAEGHARGTRKDYANFISIARGSTAELETLLLITRETGLLSQDGVDPLLADCDEVGRMLSTLSSRLRETSSETYSLKPKT